MRRAPRLDLERIFEEFLLIGLRPSLDPVYNALETACSFAILSTVPRPVRRSLYHNATGDSPVLKLWNESGTNRGRIG